MSSYFEVGSISSSSTNHCTFPPRCVNSASKQARDPSSAVTSFNFFEAKRAGDVMTSRRATALLRPTCKRVVQEFRARFINETNWRANIVAAKAKLTYSSNIKRKTPQITTTFTRNPFQPPSAKNIALILHKEKSWLFYSKTIGAKGCFIQKDRLP